MSRRRGREEEVTPRNIGVTLGQEIYAGSPEWARLSPLVGLIVEGCLLGSSVGAGVATEEWFAGLIQEVKGSTAEGWLLGCLLLGCEREAAFEEVASGLSEGYLHLCPGEPCLSDHPGPLVHVTRTRFWEPLQFQCEYLTELGKTGLKKAVTAQKKRATIAAKGKGVAGVPPATPQADRGRGRGRGIVKRPAKRKKKEEDGGPSISLLSEDEEESEGNEEVPEVTPRRGALRDTLRRTRERILGQGGQARPHRDAGGLSGGRTPEDSARAAATSRLVAGTALNPAKQTPLQLAPVVDTNDSTMRNLTKRLSGAGNASSALVTQALEQSVTESKNRKRKRRDKDKKDGVKQLVDLLKGKRKKKKKRRSRSRAEDRVKFKKDPEDPGDSSSSGYSSESGYSEDEDSEGSDLDFEPPLRRKATKDPGSVMAMLVKHAQDQMDRGALLESEGARASLTSGIKISTYFALMIRPYHPSGSPLLRELYALAQAIDLLRIGKLPETADALASRFIAVHTALGDGNWLTASQLELYPLEATQSATTATMLQAQKHRKLSSKRPMVGWHWPGKRRRLWREREERRPQRQGEEQEQVSREGQLLMDRQGGDKSLERQQGGPSEEGPLEAYSGALLNSETNDGLVRGLVGPVPFPPGFGSEMRFFRRLAGRCTCFDSIGRALAWVLINFPRLEVEKTVSAGFRFVFLGKSSMDYAMHRGRLQRRRPLFPLPLGDTVQVEGAAKLASFEDFCQPGFGGLTTEDVWVALSVLGLNGTAGCGRAALDKEPSVLQRGALRSIRQSIRRVLPLDLQLMRTASGAEKELSSRFLNYTGEEVPKMQILRVEAAVGALPPATHGGAIDARLLVSEGSRWFLEHPEESLLEEPPPKVKLQAKVHIHPGEALEFCKLLVERRICTWIPDDEVLTIKGSKADAGLEMHQSLEDAWRRSGVLSSDKKRVSNAETADELGAHLDGQEGTIGPSGERLLKLVQTTLVCLGSAKLRRKWIQVVAGRWVHVMSFRRPAMVCLDATWAFVAGKQVSGLLEARVRSELLGCCCIGLLLHGNLRAQLSSITTASDASSTGGAVGMSSELTLSGSQFAAADQVGWTEGKVAPILVVSLFNGVGCTFRCYDLCGVTPLVAFSYEIDAAANRITARRWPNVHIEKDVRTLTAEVIRGWRYAFPLVEEIHVWGGFPCVGLSAVRAGRLNLEDPQSSLFWELVRVVKEIRHIFGFNFPVRYVAENVASMDASAEAEITRALGTKPWRLDPAGAVPIHRPRFCWTNTGLSPMDGVVVEEKERWIQDVALRICCVPCLRGLLLCSWPLTFIWWWLTSRAVRIQLTMTAAHSFWAGHASRSERRLARQNVVLEDVGITAATLERYYLAVSRLEPVLEEVSTEYELDEFVASWVQSEFEDGTPLHLVGDALSGLHHFEPFTKKRLPKAWRLYGIWRKFEVPFRAPPLTHSICLAMAGWAIQHDELTMGALLLLGFHCLLRTGEILQLRPCDFIIDRLNGVVSLPSSKSGVRNNSRESVTIRDPVTLETTQAMLDLRQQMGFPRTPCWDRSGSAFRNLFRKILGELDLSELNFRPYSLRRDGHGAERAIWFAGGGEAYSHSPCGIFVTCAIHDPPGLYRCWANVSRARQKQSRLLVTSHDFLWNMDVLS
eukprot:s1285_g17.t1